MEVALLATAMFFGASCGGDRFIIGDHFVDGPQSVEELAETSI